MTMRDDDVRVRPRRIDRGNRGAKRPKTFVGEVMRAAKRAGHVGDDSDQARAGAAPGSAVAGRTIFSSRTLNSPVIPRLERSSRRVPMRLFLTWDGVVANVETTRRSKSITKQPMLTWFVCTTNNGPLVSQQVSFMKPRVGVYLSEGMAARLAEAAEIPRATRSALVEATLDRFLGSDDDVSDTATVARRLAGLSRQLEELDRNLRIANETAALHARFHLAVTPLMPEREQGAACALGAERFDEFAIQVGRRVDLEVPPHPGDDRQG